jgi:hypothetical protein
MVPRVEARERARLARSRQTRSDGGSHRRRRVSRVERVERAGCAPDEARHPCAFPSPLAGEGGPAKRRRMRGHPSPGRPLPRATRPSGPARGQALSRKGRGSAHAPSVPGPRSGITAVQRADLGPKEGSGMPVLRPCLSATSGLGAQVPPDIPRRSFRLLSGHPFGWADGSARSPGYRNRDRGTRPRLRQRCPVSTAVPPPETSAGFIGINAGFVK